jgi:hypothetical protein
MARQTGMPGALMLTVIPRAVEPDITIREPVQTTASRDPGSFRCSGAGRAGAPNHLGVSPRRRAHSPRSLAFQEALFDYGLNTVPTFLAPVDDPALHHGGQGGSGPWLWAVLDKLT